MLIAVSDKLATIFLSVLSIIVCYTVDRDVSAKP